MAEQREKQKRQRQEKRPGRQKQHYSGIGGQAVLEGVMMKNGSMYAVAVRRPDGQIETEVDEYHGPLENTIWTKLPFVRGVFVFLDSLILGMKSLSFSTSFYEEETEEPTKLDRALDRISGGKGEKLIKTFTMVMSFLFAIGLFVVLPLWVSERLNVFIRSASLMAIIEGVLRLVFFLVYIVAISAMKDIRRLYQYHGAEHKCINCLESGKPLTVRNVRRSTRFHRRCGSSFLILVVLVSIVLFFFIRVDSRVLRLLLRFVLIPVISGISYEIIRLAGRGDNLFLRVLSAPGLWLQRITTKEPDNEMIRVAIASVEAVCDWKRYLREEFGYTEQELEESL
ncbi:DUF1385 domain-containing protein [Lachnoclostridium sp. Marseille-P6806]|uniref:DUF1385 domain-containing protein n=1 Tax=Lachnoclostridium sp. Marseille-P6806 TaxID=2364793 RepID=UPI00102F6B9E|nr:DUF1385 domain-containing protein [Lachnoclostridium sp. Marseille-P6806]